ncbi:glycosyltransferase family 4 protein [Desulfonatronovibrio hydrogenovorans]|uniref:glycosyltransferase family 4 protein n=1 Tax=Desulfonatronovibrio hydrogenovorans TaxID=53245 RepID=UPI00048F5ADE|nr:glycosyltransferase family 4 protein [Desulfonatronovibrio hydrogenovorans]
MKSKEISILMFDAAYPPPILGGKEKQAHLLAKELSRQGVDCKALSYKHSGNSSEDHEGILVDRVSPGIWAVPNLFLRLVALRRKFKILHIHTPSRIGKIMVLLGFLLGYRIVFKFPNEHLLNSKHFIDRTVWTMLCWLVDLCVVLEEDTKNKLIDKGVNKKNIFFVANGVEMSQCKGISESKKQIELIYVGRLVPQKACDQLIKACKILRKKNINFSLKIIGDGPLKNEMVHLVYDLNLGEQVYFVGYSNNPLAYMERSDILVLPSLHEGMPNALLEAISIGLPIVSTDVGAVRKQVGSFGEQFLCKPDDPECLAEKIYLLAGDPFLRKEYSKYLYKRGGEMFSIQAIAKQYIEKYKKL